MSNIVEMLDVFGIAVIGSENGTDVVRLIIEGDIVPDVPSVTVEVRKVIGKQYAQLTALCVPVT